MNKRKRKDAKDKKNYLGIFLILLGISIIIESFYYFLISFSFVQAITSVGMKPGAFVIFTYIFILFKFIVGIFAIVEGKRVM